MPNKSEVQSSPATAVPKSRGSFIVIEGTEGSGKSTQLRLLAAQLERDGHQVAMFNFPRYDDASSYFIKRYRHGDYGDTTSIAPYSASLFYTLDQYDASTDIRKALQQGKVVLCNHFVSGTMVQQGIKLSNVEERRGFFIWLDNLVFETLKIPRPDLNIILRIPAEVSNASTVEAFDDLCKLFPKDFSRIDCVRGGELLTTDAVNKLVSEKARSILPELVSQYEAVDDDSQPVAASLLPAFTIPTEFDAETTELYSQSLTSILDSHVHIKSHLEDYLEQQSDTPQNDRDALWRATIGEQADRVVQAILPVATDDKHYFQHAAQPNPRLETAVKDLLSTTHTDAIVKQVSLSDVSPRNEIDLVVDIAFASADMPYAELRMQADGWSYDQKTAVFTTGISTDGALQKVRYSWDIVSSYATFCAFRSSSSNYDIQWQALTPRLGYSIPKLVEDAELADEFEACFDASLKLYSQLQHKGHESVAANATLYGHRLRWNITLHGSELKALLTESKKHGTSVELQSITRQMYQKLTEIHPLIALAMNYN